jgi:hypothetical protein
MTASLEWLVKTKALEQILGILAESLPDFLVPITSFSISFIILSSSAYENVKSAEDEI